MAQTQICKFYMDKGCNNGNCKFFHDPDLCVTYWTEGQCLIPDCRYNHKYINQICKYFLKFGTCKFEKCKFIHKQNKDKKRIKSKKNTECFEPLDRPVDLRLLIDNNTEKLNVELSDRDLLLVPNLFSNYNKLEIYNNLVNEIKTCGIDQKDLLKLWHGNDKNPGTHLICDDKLDWKSKCPTFSYVINKLKDYFNVDIKATRFNWYVDTNQWKPFHHDAAAIDPKKAANQNITIAVSFGCTRTIGLESAEKTKETRKVISFEQKDGDIYVFTNKTNELWKHGILQEKEFKNEGRISIIIWGKVNNVFSL